MPDDSKPTGSISAGLYPQVIFNPTKDDLAAILAEQSLWVLVSAIAVTPTQIVLRFGIAPEARFPAIQPFYVPSVFRCQVLPHLPAPAEDANGW